MDPPPSQGKIKRLWSLIKQHKWKTIIGAGTLCLTLGTLWWWIRFGKNKLTQYFLRKLLDSEFRAINVDFELNDNSSLPSLTKPKDFPLPLYNNNSNSNSNNHYNNNALNIFPVDKNVLPPLFTPPKSTEFFTASLQTADLTTQNLLPLLLRRIKIVTNVQNLLDQIKALQSPSLSSTNTNSLASLPTTTTSTAAMSSESMSTNAQHSLNQLDSTDRIERKQQLWQQLKVVALVEWLTSVYALCALLVYIRLQVLLLSSYTVASEHMKSLKSVPSTTSSSVSPLITDETRRLYLQTNEYFLNQGLIDLVQHITTTISPHLTRYSLDQLLTFADTLQLLGTLRQAIETPQTSALWSRILLPTEHASTLPPHFSSTASSNPLSEADKLVLLLNETRDIIESPPFSVLIQKCAHVTFANTLCYLKNAFGNQSIPVAKLIPLLHRHCSNLLQTENNEILATIAFNKEITDYSLFALQTSFLEEYPI